MNRLKKNIMMLSGILCISIATTICAQVSLGTAPCTTLNLGLSSKLPISFGTTQLITNLIFFLSVIFFERKFIGFGTIVNMVGIGFLVDFLTPLYRALIPNANSLVIRLLLLAVGIVIQTLGVSLYLTADLGISPYDALGLVISKKSRIKFSYCRMATDVACVLAGFMLGSAVGIGTLILAFFTGPLVSFWNKNLSEPIMNSIKRNDICKEGLQ